MRVSDRNRDRCPVLGERRVVACSRVRRLSPIEINGGCTVVDLGDLDDRVRQVACDRSIVDDHVDDAGFGRRIDVGVEPDLQQCRLIVGSRCGAREREDPGDGIVDARRDAARKRRCVNGQTVPSVKVRECDGRGDKVWTVDVDDRDIGVDDGDSGSPVDEGRQIVDAAGRRAVRVEIEHRGVVHWIDSDRDNVGVGGGPVAGRDRERVAAVEVWVAGIGEARQRRVDLSGRAGDAYAGGAVAADAGAGGHVEDAARHIERGGERAAVDVRHRDAGDRQDSVLGDALRARHGIDRGVVHWIDGDRDNVGVDGGPVVGRDRERVGAVEVEVAGIGEARQRRVDLQRPCR